MLAPEASRASGHAARGRRGAPARRGFWVRAGREGRLRVWRRRGGLDRGLAPGEAGLGRWGGWAMLPAHRGQIARTRVTRQGA
jgi:hypothetical protein